jgi:hypothetical protein
MAVEPIRPKLHPKAVVLDSDPGWSVFVPPGDAQRKSSNPSAPFARWMRGEAFGSVRECEHYLQRVEATQEDDAVLLRLEIEDPAEPEAVATVLACAIGLFLAFTDVEGGRWVGDDLRPRPDRREADVWHRVLRLKVAWAIRFGLQQPPAVEAGQSAADIEVWDLVPVVVAVEFDAHPLGVGNIDSRAPQVSGGRALIAASVVIAVLLGLVFTGMAWASPRSWQPVILRGAQTPALLGRPIEGLEVLARRAKRFVRSPFRSTSGLRKDVLSCLMAPSRLPLGRSP